MNNTNEIIPSPGTESKDWPSLEQKLQILKLFAHTIHIDIVDGKFAPNSTFSNPKPFQQYTQDLLFEVHLMVDEPINYVKPFAEAGFRRFIGHIEKMSDQNAFIKAANEYGDAMLAVDATTSLHDITVPFDHVDGILIMTIHAGFSGQEFLRPLLEKVRHLRQTHIPIEVDGGINDKTILYAKEAGVTRFVTTSYILNNHSPERTFLELQKIIK